MGDDVGGSPHARSDAGDLAPGLRVQITATPIGVTLARSTGVIVRPDEWDGYYVIRLDAPAVFHHADGTDEPHDEIVEAADNFTVLAKRR